MGHFGRTDQLGKPALCTFLLLRIFKKNWFKFAETLLGKEQAKKWVAQRFLEYWLGRIS